MELQHRIEEADYCLGLTFLRKRWHRPSDNPDWDHDHCAACWARIWDRPEAEAGSFGEGYASVADARWPDDYHWLCPPCFAALRAPLDLKEQEAKQ